MLEFADQRGFPSTLHHLNEIFNRQIEASTNDDYRQYTEHSLLFRRAIILTSNNDSMMQIMDALRDIMIMKSIAHWKLTPHQKHYFANQFNESAYQA